MRAYLDDLRLQFDLMWLGAKDALARAWRAIVATAETPWGSALVWLAGVALWVIGASGIEAVTAHGAVFRFLSSVGFGATLAYFLPFNIARRRQQREEEIRLAKYYAEGLGYSRGYDDGWRNCKAVNGYYAAQAYHIRSLEPED